MARQLTVLSSPSKKVQSVKPLTPDQLRVAAQNVAYRTEQLAGAALISVNGVKFTHSTPGCTLSADARMINALRNAFIESALVNARSLAWFITDARDVTASTFLAAWNDDVVAVAREVTGPISQHLGHITSGHVGGEPHPGHWPIVELAVVLVNALARWHRTLVQSDPIVAAHFLPTPMQSFSALITSEPLAKPTPISSNPSVGKLTKRLQDYLAAHTHELTII